MKEETEKKQAKPWERCYNFDTIKAEVTNCRRWCDGDKQATRKCFDPMPDPQKCPECDKEINEVAVLYERKEYSVYFITQRDPDTLGIRPHCSTAETEVFDRVQCPECNEILPFDSIEEAKEFLKTGKLPKQE